MGENMDTNTLVVAAVAFAILGAALAEYRRRTILEGALLGLLLGPIGVLIVLLWPGKKEADEPVSQPAAPSE